MRLNFYFISLKSEIKLTNSNIMFYPTFTFAIKSANEMAVGAKMFELVIFLILLL